jgi:general secretion pathway protein K
VDDFLKRLPRATGTAVNELSVSSGYFLATLSVTIGGAQARGKALLARAAAGWPVVVWRKYL